MRGEGRDKKQMGRGGGKGKKRREGREGEKGGNGRKLPSIAPLPLAKMLVSEFTSCLYLSLTKDSARPSESWDLVSDLSKNETVYYLLPRAV